jgi:phospholipase C
MQINSANPNIKHVFVLMLENRSFDHMLGFSSLSGFDSETGFPTSIHGTDGADQNSYLGVPYPTTKPADFIMPCDPGHEFLDVVEQLCGAGVKYDDGPYPKVNNTGFVSNYATTQSSGEGDRARTDFGEIMKCYDSAAQLPILNTLAREFAVCDNWFSSLPGPTWPNRFFVHAASSGGLDHSPSFPETLEWLKIDGFSFPNGTIYDRMNTGNKTWRIYHGAPHGPIFGSLPCVAGLRGITLSRTYSYKTFAADLQGDYSYSYTFIEPNYGDIVHSTFTGGQSEHPMDDVRNGEGLIKSTYEAIRNSPLWPKSLLIITYDEHGGFYDHVTPPGVTAPGDTQPGSKYNTFRFPFTQYGVRVPAVVISAYTQKNSISHRVFDHSSVPATLEAIFVLPSLTDRDEAANNLTSLAALQSMRTDTLSALPNVAEIAPEQMAAALARQTPGKKDSDPVDGGNLPGFLHIVMKAKMEHEALEPHRLLRMSEFREQIKTRGDAKQFFDSELPGLMGSDFE